MQFKQAVIECSLKHGVTTSAIRYKTSRQNIYRRRKKYDGTVRSQTDRSYHPHSHPDQHTEAAIKLVKDMRRRNTACLTGEAAGKEFYQYTFIDEYSRFH